MSLIDLLRKRTMPMACALIACLLVLRDLFGLFVPKLVFLMICVAALFFMKTEQVTLFLFFLVPLYAGLPSNFLTVFLLIRLLISVFYERKTLVFSVPAAVSCCMFCGYILAQNLLFGYTSIYEYALCAEILLLFFLHGEKPKRPRTALTLYALAVILAGFCALAVYAREYSLADILSGYLRFGDIYGEGGMRMTIDPNFLGFLCIAGIALETEALRADLKRAILKKETVISVCLLMPLLFLGFVGLSRSFFVCLLFLLICEFAVAVRRPFSLFVYFSVMGLFSVLASVVIRSYFGELLQTLFDRFAWNEVQNANGRVTLIFEWLLAWTSSLDNFFFGVGLFETNVHMAALQYVFGLGIVGAGCAFSFCFFWGESVGFRLKGYRIIPFLVTALMSCTVPAAASLSAFFPLVAVLFIDPSGDAPR